MLLTIVLQLATIYLPLFNRIFHTAPLTKTELAVAFGLATVVFLAVEVEKLIRRYWLRRPRSSHPRNL